MARKKSSAIDKARQAIGKAIIGSVKSSRKSIHKKITQVQRDRESDLVAKWRALKKLGLINTRNNPSKKHLTSRLKTKINKEFYAIQGEGQYVRGKTIRPFIKETVKTKSGIHVKYNLSDYFHLIKTKNKTEIRTGIIKTSKGYLAQKKSKNSRVTINKKGEVLETIGKERYRKKSYSGAAILDLYTKAKDGTLKIPRGERMVLNKFGSFGRNQEMYEKDSLDEFIATIDAYAKEMSSIVFQDFLDRSEVMFIRG